MGKDKILGYVQALIDKYHSNFENEEDEVSRIELSTMLDDLGNLRSFIESNGDEDLRVELDNKALAKAVYRGMSKQLR